MLKLHPYLTLLLFILIVAGVSFTGSQFLPGEWYAHLVKPGWTPPNWVFPIAWGILYLMIAVAGWLLFSGSAPVPKILWVAQLVFNGFWSWLFFGLHQMGLGLADLLAMVVCTFFLLMTARQNSKRAFWLLVPYMIWISYASTLNIGIYLLNPA